MRIKTTPLMQHPSKATGFTLIEVLVTVIVVSIGLLGLAGLQINGLRANMSSEARSKATLLASDIIERMRANPLGVAAGGYDGVIINAASCATPPSPLCGNTSTADVAGSCTATEMADFDVWVWGCGTAASGVQGGGVTNQLPGGTARVSCAAPCPAGSPHTVTVSWSERSPSSTAAATAGTATIQNITLTIVP